MTDYAFVIVHCTVFSSLLKYRKVVWPVLSLSINIMSISAQCEMKSIMSENYPKVGGEGLKMKKF